MTDFKGRYYVRSCKVCGEVFKTSSEKGYICKSCKCRKRVKSVDKESTQHRKVYAKKKSRDADISISQMLERLERFNKVNGTAYTYGRFVSMMCNERR